VLIIDNMSSSVVTRKFGTDVSNIPSDISRKTTQKIIPRQHNAKSQSAKVTKNEKRISSPVSKPLFDVMESLMNTLVNDIVIDDEITIKSPVKENKFSVDCRYDRDFMLSFQKLCTDPIYGLIPEVTPGYVHPEASTQTTVGSSSTPFSSRTSDSSSSLPSDASSTTSNTSPSIVSSSEVTAVKVGSPASKSKKSSSKSSRVAITESSSSIESSSIKSKKIKKEKPRELDEKRIAARQKQIDIGMNTDGYRRFTSSVPVESRTKAHPRVPDVHQVCSKRSWDGQVRKWRRQLHDYDLPEAAGQVRSAADQDLDEVSSEGEDASDNEEEQVATNA